MKLKMPPPEIKNEPLIQFHSNLPHKVHQNHEFQNQKKKKKRQEI